MSAATDAADLRQNIARLDTFMNGGAGAGVELKDGTEIATLAGLIGSSASDTEPAATWPGRHWYDTSDPDAPVLRVRDPDDAAWINLPLIALVDIAKRNILSTDLLASIPIDRGVERVRVEGETGPGQGPAVEFVRVSSVPAHRFRARSADRELPGGAGEDLVDGGWWALEGTQGLGEFDAVGALWTLNTWSGIAGRHVPFYVTSIRFAWHHSIAHGGGGLARRTQVGDYDGLSTGGATGEPHHALKTRSADRNMRHGALDAANGGWWTLVAEAGEARASQAGAEEGADVWQAGQDLFDFCIYGDPGYEPAASRALVDVHAGTLSDWWWIGYGDAYRTVEVRGLGKPYQGTTAKHGGTALVFTKTDRPPIVAHAFRGLRIGGMAIIGPANDALNFFPGPLETLQPEHYDEKTWDLALRSVGIVPNCRHAPRAGLVLDGFSGPPPAAKTVSAISGASPAVVTFSAVHGLLQYTPETITAAGMSGIGLADGDYYAVYVGTSQVALYNLDWTPVDGASLGAYGGGGTFTQPGFPAKAFPAWYVAAGFDADLSDGQKRGSQAWIEGLDLLGFEVGTAINPGTQGSNTDFVNFVDVDLYRCKVGHSVGHVNARLNHWHRCDANTVATVWVNARHGVATGAMVAKATGCGGSYVMRLWDFSASSRMRGMEFDGCHWESSGRLGDVRGGGTTATPLLWTNSEFNARWDGGMPPNLLAAGSDSMPIEFTGGVLQFDYTAVMLANNVRFRGTALTRNMPATKSYEKVGHNGTCGVLTRGRSIGAPLYQYYSLAGGATQDGSAIADDACVRTGRDNRIPHWLSRGLHPATPDGQPNPRWEKPFIKTVVAAGHRASEVVTDRTLSFTYTASSDPDTWVASGIENGNVILDETSGTAAVIRSTDPGTGAVLATLMTNFVDNGDGTFSLFEPWDPEIGNWTVIHCTLLTPDRRLTGDFTSGSPTVTNVEIAGTPAAPALFGLSVTPGAEDRFAGFLLGDGSLYAAVDDTRAIAADTSAKTITLAANARLTRTRVPLDLWWGAPLPDEAAV